MILMVSLENGEGDRQFVCHCLCLGFLWTLMSVPMLEVSLCQESLLLHLLGCSFVQIHCLLPHLQVLILPHIYPGIRGNIPASPYFLVRHFHVVDISGLILELINAIHSLWIFLTENKTAKSRLKFFSTRSMGHTPKTWAIPIYLSCLGIKCALLTRFLF
jgi:hypothetical protein